MSSHSLLFSQSVSFPAVACGLSFPIMHFYESSTFPKLLSQLRLHASPPQWYLRFPSPLILDQSFLVLILTLTAEGESAGAYGRSVSLTERPGLGPRRESTALCCCTFISTRTGLPAWENIRGRRKAGAGSLILHYVPDKHCSPQQEMKKILQPSSRRCTVPHP